MEPKEPILGVDMASGPDQMVRAIRDSKGALIILAADEPFEYFCKNCQQLRLCFVPQSRACRNCSSTDLVIGKVGTLNKQKLVDEALEDSVFGKQEG